MTTVTSHDHRTFALEVTTTAHGRTVRASGRLLVGAGADHPVWAGLVAGDALEHVTLDLCAVTAIDAGGLGRLLRVRQRLGARGARLTISAAAAACRPHAPHDGPRRDLRDRVGSGSVPGQVDRHAALPCRCA
jgi:STAS domain